MKNNLIEKIVSKKMENVNGTNCILSCHPCFVCA